jgi:site-specific DNA-methyltransferase (adenine-specific)
MNVAGKTVGTAFVQPLGRWPANLIHDGSDEVLAAFPQAVGQIADASSSSSSRKTQNVYGAMTRGSGGGSARNDAGSAARFFYCAKTSRTDRGPDNTHPTVKPTDLMRYLCRLVTPAGGVVLDPFMGSGSTGKAAVLEGFRFIGIELDPQYVEIAERRIATAIFGPAAIAA